MECKDGITNLIDCTVKVAEKYAVPPGKGLQMSAEWKNRYENLRGDAQDLRQQLDRAPKGDPVRPHLLKQWRKVQKSATRMNKIG